MPITDVQSDNFNNSENHSELVSRPNTDLHSNLAITESQFEDFNNHENSSELASRSNTDLHSNLAISKSLSDNLDLTPDQTIEIYSWVLPVDFTLTIELF